MKHLGTIAAHAALQVGAAMLLVFAGSSRAGEAAKPAAGADKSQGVKKMIEVTSSAFLQSRAIPKKYTGEGADISPPLSWAGVPTGTKELALICDDPDAPQPEPWVHWVIYKIPADMKLLPEAIPRKAKLIEPNGALQGRNSWPDTGYRGPMPPKGHGVHHYYFSLYALDKELPATPDLDKKALLKEMQGHILAKGVLMGTYERK